MARPNSTVQHIQAAAGAASAAAPAPVAGASAAAVAAGVVVARHPPEKELKQSTFP